MKYKLHNDIKKALHSALLQAVSLTAVTLHSTTHILLLGYLIQSAS